MGYQPPSVHLSFTRRDILAPASGSAFGGRQKRMEGCMGCVQFRIAALLAALIPTTLGFSQAKLCRGVDSGFEALAVPHPHREPGPTQPSQGEICSERVIMDP
jgi:hypothetical protein